MQATNGDKDEKKEALGDRDSTALISGPSIHTIFENESLAEQFITLVK